MTLKIRVFACSRAPADEMSILNKRMLNAPWLRAVNMSVKCYMISRISAKGKLCSRIFLATCVAAGSPKDGLQEKLHSIHSAFNILNQNQSNCLGESQQKKATPSTNQKRKMHGTRTRTGFVLFCFVFVFFASH